MATAVLPDDDSPARYFSSSEAHWRLSMLDIDVSGAGEGEGEEAEGGTVPNGLADWFAADRTGDGPATSLV